MGPLLPSHVGRCLLFVGSEAAGSGRQQQDEEQQQQQPSATATTALYDEAAAAAAAAGLSVAAAASVHPAISSHVVKAKRDSAYPSASRREFCDA